ncbi:MAG: peptide chain release factor N(5)-glutamine methyltransferase [Bacteroidetes bacterium]|nr:peptide chain release factor N(5)-glutamine methyltransferase [Bacteroidota bacterium]
MNEFLGYTRRHLQLKANQSLGEKETERFKIILSDLKKHKPIQYILGYTEFYGLKIRVNEHVLIPRLETEELVEEILQGTTGRGQGMNILDIGTGSGCIAIALKKNLPEATVSAFDISDEALLVAKQNSILNHTLINFLQGDILKLNNSFTHQLNNFDIIVSNPPYVQQSEKSSMSKNVLNYEPHLALFVDDTNPLLFYNSIADFALQNLSQSGKLYFEINEAMGNEIKKLLENKGFKNVEIKKDMSGKDRIALSKRQ